MIPITLEHAAVKFAEQLCEISGNPRNKNAQYIMAAADASDLAQRLETMSRWDEIRKIDYRKHINWHHMAQMAALGKPYWYDDSGIIVSRTQAEEWRSPRIPQVV